jgi:hypothetical protein
LEFYDRDGVKKELKPLGGKGRVGQVVVLAFVKLREAEPLAKYSQPSIFTIAERVGDSCRLVDSEGMSVTVKRFHARLCLDWFYDATEFLRWNAEREEAEMWRRDQKEHNLCRSVELLTGIMERQGVRVITESQAAELGITP